MTLLEKRRQLAFRPKAAALWPAHYYGGTRNTWYGEPVHYCGGCGEFEDHDKSKVEQHVKEENERRTA